MSSSNVARQQFRRLLQKSPKLRKGIQDVKYEVFANLPQLNMRTGHQANKRQLKGVYINQYYLDPIEKSARKVIPGFQTELEERRAAKLDFMKRRGKGPPKKGAGARQTKKK